MIVPPESGMGDGLQNEANSLSVRCLLEAIAASKIGGMVATSNKDGIVRFLDSTSGPSLHEWHRDEPRDFRVTVLWKSRTALHMAQTGDSTTASWSTADGDRKKLSVEVKTAELAQLTASTSQIHLYVRANDTEITGEGHLNHTRCRIPKRLTTVPNQYSIEFLATRPVSAGFYACQLEIGETPS
jgi:hypothetical protein